MALMGSRIENFDKSGFLMPLGDFDILVSSISFQKSKIVWPPSERVAYSYARTTRFRWT